MHVMKKCPDPAQQKELEDMTVFRDQLQVTLICIPRVHKYY